MLNSGKPEPEPNLVFNQPAIQQSLGDGRSARSSVQSGDKFACCYIGPGAAMVCIIQGDMRTNRGEAVSTSAVGDPTGGGQRDQRSAQAAAGEGGRGGAGLQRGLRIAGPVSYGETRPYLQLVGAVPLPDLSLALGQAYRRCAELAFELRNELGVRMEGRVPAAVSVKAKIDYAVGRSAK